VKARMTHLFAMRGRVVLNSFHSLSMARQSRRDVTAAKIVPVIGVCLHW